MNIKVAPLITILLSLTLLTGWTPSFFKTGPSIDEYTQFLEKLISSTIKETATVHDVEILADENIGSKIEPKYQARVKANLKIEEPLYITERTILGKKVVKKSVNEGEIFKLTSLIQSTLNDDEKWVLKFIKKPSITPAMSGNPLSKFQEGGYVIAGSNAENALIEEKRLSDIAKQKARDEDLARLESEKNSLISSLEGKWVSTLIQTNYRNRGKLKEVIVDKGKNKESLIYTLTFNDKGQLHVDINGSKGNLKQVSTTANTHFNKATHFTFQTETKGRVENLKTGRRHPWKTGNVWNVELKDNKLIAIQSDNHLKWIITLEKV